MAPRTARDPPIAEDPERDPPLATTLAVLNALANAGRDCGVQELARTLGIPKPRIFRHLTALKKLGFVAQDSARERYRIGYASYLFGKHLMNAFSAPRIVAPFMEALCREIDETVVMGTYDDNAVTVLDFVARPSAIEIGLRPGSRFAFNAAAQGKVVLAFGPPHIAAHVFGSPLQRVTPRTITKAAVLKDEIQRCRENGWAEAPDELFLGINALAAPLFYPDGSLMGTLAIVGFTEALRGSKRKKALRKLISTAAEISASLARSDTRSDVTAPKPRE